MSLEKAGVAINRSAKTFHRHSELLGRLMVDVSEIAKTNEILNRKYRLHVQLLDLAKSMEDMSFEMAEVSRQIVEGLGGRVD